MQASLDKLLSALSALPGIGRRSAERIAVHLVSGRDGQRIERLVQALTEAAQSVCCCRECGAITGTERNPCEYCTSPRRDSSLLCVVESPEDVSLVEKAGVYRGRYHVLGGRLSPLKKQSVEALGIDALLERVAQGGFEEVILALNANVESDATVQYIKMKLEELDVRVSRIATGIPMGSSLAYADPLTLNRALADRRPL